MDARLISNSLVKFQFLAQFPVDHLAKPSCVSYYYYYYYI